MEHNTEQESVMEIAKIKALKFNTKIVTWIAAQVSYVIKIIGKTSTIKIFVCIIGVLNFI